MISRSDAVLLPGGRTCRAPAPASPLSALTRTRHAGLWLTLRRAPRRYAGGIVFLMNLAIVVQYKVTAKNVDHGGFLNKTKKDEVPDNQQGLVPSNTQVRYV